MSEPVRIKISPDSKMVEIPIEKKKLWKTRVELDVMLEIWTEGNTEEEAGKVAEQIAFDLPRALEDAQDGVYVTNWGTVTGDIEEYKEDDDDGEV